MHNIIMDRQSFQSLVDYYSLFLQFFPYFECHSESSDSFHNQLATGLLPMKQRHQRHHIFAASQNSRIPTINLHHSNICTLYVKALVVWVFVFMWCLCGWCAHTCNVYRFVDAFIYDAFVMSACHVGVQTHASMCMVGCV